MKIQKMKLLIIIPLFLFIVFIGLFISMRNVDKQTYDTTIEYTATVKDIVINDNKAKKTVEIYTNEFNNYFFISGSITDYIEISGIDSLKEGEKIYFRIENHKTKDINKVTFIDIVSLGNESKTIFSLQDYNKSIQEAVYPARVTAITMAVLSLGIFLISFKRYKRIKVYID